VVENRKLLWPPTFFDTLRSPEISTNRPPTEVHTATYIISGSVHCPVSWRSLCYWKVRSRTWHTNASNE